MGMSESLSERALWIGTKAHMRNAVNAARASGQCVQSLFRGKGEGLLFNVKWEAESWSYG